MPNEILTPDQFTRFIMDDAAEVVSTMPIDSVRKLASTKEFRIGIGGGLHAAMCVAAVRRLETEQK